MLGLLMPTLVTAARHGHSGHLDSTARTACTLRGRAASEYGIPVFHTTMRPGIIHAVDRRGGIHWRPPFVFTPTTRRGHARTARRLAGMLIPLARQGRQDADMPSMGALSERNRQGEPQRCCAELIRYCIALQHDLCRDICCLQLLQSLGYRHWEEWRRLPRRRHRRSPLASPLPDEPANVLVWLSSTSRQRLEGPRSPIETSKVFLLGMATPCNAPDSHVHQQSFQQSYHTPSVSRRLHSKLLWSRRIIL